MQVDGDEKYRDRRSANEDKDKSAKQPPPAQTSIWRIPRPVQRLFNKFPYLTLPPNELPLRAPRHRDQNSLYVFSNDEDARSGAPSFNPGCLKWQTLLKFAHVPFQLISSSNHASPSGALPFLIPTRERDTPFSADPITALKLESWIQKQVEYDTLVAPSPPRLTAYTTLLSHSVRLAYLYALYLCPATFQSVTHPLYIQASTRSPLVRYLLEGPLRSAALSELVSTSNGPEPVVDAEKLLEDADDAFDALSVLLGEAEWFSDGSSSLSASASAMSSHARPASTFGQNPRRHDELDDQGERQRSSGFGLFDDAGEAEDHPDPPHPTHITLPGLLDASVFAYTHVILLLLRDQEDNSPARRLHDFIAKRQNLLDHRNRLLQRYFSVYYNERWHWL